MRAIFTVRWKKEQTGVNDPPTIEETEAFWANIWETNKDQNKEASSGEKRLPTTKLWL